MTQPRRFTPAEIQRVRRSNQYLRPEPFSSISDELAADIISRRNDGYTLTALADYSGLPEDVVASIIGARVRGNYRRQLAYYRDLAVSPWSPDCMSPEELETWSSRDKTDPSLPPRPCFDCDIAFAAANRYIGTCNGTLPYETFDSRIAFREAS